MSKTFQQIIDATTREGRLADPETPGLYLRIGVKRKTWCYHKFGKPRASLGSYPQHSLDDARQWTRGLNGMSRTAWSLKYVVERITAKALQKNNRKPTYIQETLKLGCSDWMGHDLGSITKAMVNDRHDRIAVSRGRVAAHRFIQCLRVVYNFASNQLDYEGRNPTKGVETIPPKPRQRVLTDQEAHEFLARTTAEPYWHCFFTLLLETGARRTNVCQARWQDINLDAATWVIPASHFKTKQSHTVYLTPAAVASLRAHPQTDLRLFPGLNNPWPAFVRFRGASDFTMHDMRRTLGSRLASNNIPLQTIAAILGHRDISTTFKHYAVVSEKAMRDALGK